MRNGSEPMALLDAFQRSGDGVYAVDYDQNIVFWNAKAERILGHKAKDVIGRKCYDVIAGGDYLGHPFCGPDCDAIECARRGRAPASYEVRTRNAAGEGRWLNISIIVLVGPRKKQTLTVHLFRDVTEQRRRQLSLPPLREGAWGDDPEPGHVAARLTRRETEVLQHLACGLNNARIAEILGVSPTTVRNHIEHVLAKLGVHSKLEAVVVAARGRLL